MAVRPVQSVLVIPPLAPALRALCAALVADICDSAKLGTPVRNEPWVALQRNVSTVTLFLSRFPERPVAGDNLGKESG